MSDADMDFGKNDAFEYDQSGDKGSFYTRVYSAVRHIPRGCVSTYGDIARKAGNPRNARFVGFALHVNPEPIYTPCHRVVFADGRLADAFAFGGADTQRQLLEDEGVIFLDDGRVDLDACRYQG